MRAPLSLLLVTVLAGCASGQPGQAAPGAAAAVAPADAYTALRGALRNVATRQHAYYEAHGAYTADPGDLSLEHVDPDVALVLHASDELGWTAEATHPALPGRSCVYWYGRPGSLPPIRTKLEGRAGEAAPGTAVCDEASTR